MSISRSLDLTPAESMMILDPGEANPKTMVKYTFADLLMKKALKASTKEEKQIFGTRKRTYIRPGENYGKLRGRLKPHEEVLLNLASREPRLDLMARKFIKEVGSLKTYKSQYLADPLERKGYLKWEEKKILRFIPHNKQVLSDKGLEVQAAISKLLMDASGLQSWVKDEPEKAKAFLTVCGGNILLLQDRYDLKAIEEWSRALSRAEGKRRHIDRHGRHEHEDWDHEEHRDGKQGSPQGGVTFFDLLWYDYAWTSLEELSESIDLDSLDLDLEIDLDFRLDFDVLDSFDDFDSAFDSDFSDGGGDGGGGD